MGWTNPKTWTAVTVTVADLNTHVRDNLNAINSYPSCKISSDAAQAIVNNAWATVLLTQTEDWDTDSMHVAGTSTITIQTAGKYELSAFLAFESSTAGTVRGGRFLINGATAVGQDFRAPSSGTAIVRPYSIEQMTATWTITLEAYQDSGADLAQETIYRRWLCIRRLSE